MDHTYTVIMLTNVKYELSVNQQGGQLFIRLYEYSIILCTQTKYTHVKHVKNE